LANIIKIMKILFSHPTGNANVRAALKGIQEAGLLTTFHTSIAVFSGTIFHKLSSLKLLKELQRRQFELDLQFFTLVHPSRELGRLIASKMGFSRFTKHETGYFCIDAVYQYIDQKVAKAIRKSDAIDVVYAYEDGALHSFTEAKKLDVCCFYDLPIGYWRSARRLLEEERTQKPAWANTITGFNDSAKKLEKKDAELALADHIIVASSFTKQTLNEYPGVLAPITVIPYGFPPVVTGRIYTNAENRSLKLLFVGSLSQRKGIANLLEAVALLGDAVCLTIVGHKAVEDCQPLNDGLKRHHYIPSLPHDSILQLMQEHDVFVFPSLFEGFGLVITEAMSQGTPVITTNRTAGADLIVHGENGWLVEAGSTHALRESIENLLNNPHLVKRVGQAAMETAKQRPWDSYSKELGLFIQQKVQFNG
jgi:glycosyltransferase involved in cell wall biosynthesis